MHVHVSEYRNESEGESESCGISTRMQSVGKIRRSRKCYAYVYSQPVYHTGLPRLGYERLGEVSIL